MSRPDLIDKERPPFAVVNQLGLQQGAKFRILYEHLAIPSTPIRRGDLT